MEKVSALNYIESHPGYDKANNPKKLSVEELAPIGIDWFSGKTNKTVLSPFGIGAIALHDSSGIAIVEAPYKRDKNSAYIINSNGSLRCKIENPATLDSVMFYDAYYDDGALCFFISAHQGDFRLEIDDASGKILKITESR